jgi:glycosyltransferase involved in cell wall biosynthesis
MKRIYLKRKMKILITQETDWLKRNPAQQHHLSELMSLRGHEIRVIDYELLWKNEAQRQLCSHRQVFENVVKIHESAKVTVIRPGFIKVPWLNYLSFALTHKAEVDRQIRDFAPDVIVGFGILNSYWAVNAAGKHGIPFIYYWIDVLHRLMPQKVLQPLGLLIERMVLKRSDMVLVINEALKDLVVKLGAPEARTGILRAGIDIKQFNPLSANESTKKQYGLSGEDIVLFFMGWLYRFSGLKEVALQLAKTPNPHIKLLIVGEGDLFKELEKIQKENNLQDRLILTGKKDYSEIPGLISLVDICLLPAYPNEKIMQDIVPIKLYEYMAMQKPVIATSLPGVLKEFGTENGIVYIDRPEDVIQKAMELVENDSLKQLGLKAREFATKNSWHQIADEFEVILQQAIEYKRSGRGEWI